MKSSSSRGSCLGKGCLIAVLVFLAVIILPVLFLKVKKATKKFDEPMVAASVVIIAETIGAYQADHGEYPLFLQLLAESERERRPYLSSEFLSMKNYRWEYLRQDDNFTFSLNPDVRNKKHLFIDKSQTLHFEIGQSAKSSSQIYEFDRAQAFQRLGEYHMLYKDYVSAELAFARAVQEKADSPGVCSAYGLAMGYNGKTSEGIEVVQDCLSDHPQNKKLSRVLKFLHLKQDSGLGDVELAGGEKSKEAIKKELRILKAKLKGEEPYLIDKTYGEPAKKFETKAELREALKANNKAFAKNLKKDDRVNSFVLKTGEEIRGRVKEYSWDHVVVETTEEKTVRIYHAVIDHKIEE